MAYLDNDDVVARTQALQDLIVATIAALGDEKAKPFDIEAEFECIEMDIHTQDQLCPKVKVVKR